MRFDVPDSIIARIEELLRVVEAAHGAATSSPRESVGQLEELVERFVRYRDSGYGPHRIKEIREELEKLQEALRDPRNQSIEGEDAHALLLPVRSRVEALVRDLDQVFAPDRRRRH
jgi:hypothetical protein